MAGRGGRIVVLRAAAQSGKSSVRPGARRGPAPSSANPCLIVAPTARPAAVEFARERLEPLLSSAPFAGILHGDRHGGLGRSAAVLYRTATTGGSVSLAGAESPSQLSARGAAALILDEVARYPLTCGREGSPVALSLERTEAWRETRAVFLVSTPVEPGDPFDEWYASGDQRHWFVPCAHCGASWTPTWEHIVPGPPAAVVCPQCGVEHADGPDRLALLDAGQWRPTVEADDPEVRQRTTCPAGVQSGLDPGGDCCGPCNAPRKSDRWRPGRGPARRSRPNRTPTCPTLGRSRRGSRTSRAGLPRSPFTVAATDVQSNRIETLILGMPADRSWGCGARLLYRDPRSAVRGGGVARRSRRIWDAAGVRFGAVDAGYLPQAVKALANRDTRCLPIRRDGRRPATASRSPGGAGWCFTSSASDGVQKRSCSGRSICGWLRLPAAPWCTRSWLHSLTAEHEEVVERSGRRVTVWKQHYRRNEALDCATYALAVSGVGPASRRRRPRLLRV